LVIPKKQKLPKTKTKNAKNAKMQKTKSKTEHNIDDTQ